MAKYRFEQIALNSTAKKKPTEEDRFTYLGLEHLDPGSLTVTRWGADVAPKGEKLLMKKGDVLFGKRRAYQKKVAIAPFDGIFSAHGMVLRPREDVIDKNFFPLFISSDYFLDAAIKISVGSLSPTINWRDLKTLEFDLPDLETQRKLAAVLWSINDTMDAYKKLISAADELVKSQFIEMFGDPSANTLGWPEMRLEDACIKLTDGTHFSPESFATGEYKYITAKHIKADGFDFSNLTYVPEAIHRPIFERCNPEYGDILYIKDGATTGIAMINTLKEEFTMLSSVALIKYNRNLLDGQYLKALLNYPTFYAIMRNNMGGAAITRLTVKKLCDTLIPVPPIDNQKHFSAFVGQSDKSKFELEQALAELNATYKRIIAENLG